MYQIAESRRYTIKKEERVRRHLSVQSSKNKSCKRSKILYQSNHHEISTWPYMQAVIILQLKHKELKNRFRLLDSGADRFFLRQEMNARAGGNGVVDRIRTQDPCLLRAVYATSALLKHLRAFHVKS